MRNFRERLGKEILIFDGAAGTMLQAAGLPAGTRPELWNLTRPEEIAALHRAYIDAGSDLITTNTFGANEFHFPDGEGPSVEEVVAAAGRAARTAVEASCRDVYIGLDVGPTGKLVGEGTDLDFEDAVSAFARVIRAGRAFADVIIIETFGNLAETRAALLAAKENSSLPVVVTNVYGRDGRLFTGSSAEAVAVTLEGLGADAVGMNCSLGPAEMLGLLPSVLGACTLPVAVYPNAGLPRLTEEGKTVYEVTPEQYTAAMVRMARAGAVILGGCCGTTPEYIRRLCRALPDRTPAPRKAEACTVVASTIRTHVLGEGFTVIGERINPTGKSKLKAALRENNIEYLLGEAHNQTAAGADILDVNVGLPDIDETAMLSAAVRRIQEVCDLPLQIDSASAPAMEAALRRYHGKALINSVNGSRESMEKVFPLAAKYGGVVVGLTLDENGIPDTPEGRAAIAEKIVAEAAKYGIGRENILIDPLTLTLGADPEAAGKTLTAMRLIKERCGVCCSLGVSNISFGLPDRDRINCDFLAAAMEAGLDAAIMNPLSENMMNVALGRSDDTSDAASRLSSGIGGGVGIACDTNDLTSCVFCGMKERASALAAELCEKMPPLEVISGYVIPALEKIGREFEAGRVFLPGLLACADSAIGALGVITGRMPAGEAGARAAGRVVLATVRGDVHDIGKNIVRVMLQSYGFEVIDLGRDVAPERVLEAARESGARVVGLSALMTTTLPSMAETIALLRRELPDVRVVVGGAVLTEEYAARIGADQYAPEAMVTVRFAQKIYSE